MCIHTHTQTCTKKKYHIYIRSVTYISISCTSMCCYVLFVSLSLIHICVFSLSVHLSLSLSFSAHTYTDFTDFHNALSEFRAPASNFVFADINGDIAYVMVCMCVCMCSCMYVHVMCIYLCSCVYVYMYVAR